MHTQMHTHTRTHTRTHHLINAQAALHTGRLWIPVYLFSYIVLVNTETQTGSIYRYTSEHTGRKDTDTSAWSRWNTSCSSTTQHAIPGGDSIPFQCVLSFPVLEIAGKS